MQGVGNRKPASPFGCTQLQTACKIRNADAGLVEDIYGGPAIGKTASEDIAKIRNECKIQRLLAHFHRLMSGSELAKTIRFWKPLGKDIYKINGKEAKKLEIQHRYKH